MALLIAIVLVSVVSLGLASPIDPSHIAGIYDNADFDDVVLAVLAIEGTVGPFLLILVGVQKLCAVITPDPQSAVIVFRFVRFDRGPPTA